MVRVRRYHLQAAEALAKHPEITIARHDDPAVLARLAGEQCVVLMAS